MLFEIIVFILILSLLVFIHELGHFSTAKYFGVKVDEFGLGLPPRAIFKKVGETIYSLNWLPIGGFVQIRGENYEDYDPQDKHNFINKKPWQKFIVLFAGIFMNFMLAVVIFYVSLGTNNWKSSPLMYFEGFNFRFGETQVLSNVIIDIEANSAGEKAGLERGDRIVALSYGDKRSEIKNIDELRGFLADLSGKEITVEVENLATHKTNTVKAVPQYREELKGGALGVSMQEAIEVQYNKPVDRLLSGFEHSYNTLAYNFSIMGMLIKSSWETHDISVVSEGVSGPIGIFDVVSSVLNSGTTKLVRDIMDITALISLSLALMNFLPLPALDGGRIVFVLGEWLTGKRASPKIEAKVHQVGFAFLITLIILVTFKDVFQIFIR